MVRYIIRPDKKYTEIDYPRKWVFLGSLCSPFALIIAMVLLT